MPEMTGIELVKELRAFETENRLSLLPIVLCSGHDDKEFKRSCASTSISRVLVKPVEKDRLISTINEIIG